MRGAFPNRVSEPKNPLRTILCVHQKPAIKTLPPILVAHLLGTIDRLLVKLLRSLETEQFKLRAVKDWTVHDVAAHLLDTQLRKLSLVRDKHFGLPAPEIRSNDDVVAFIDRLNAEGVAYYKRLSPQVLISLLEVAGKENAAFHESLDPMADATFPVSWAGESTSKNWFDTARELTERWHHQQQIRETVGNPGIMTRKLYHPVLDCFLRGLPHHYRDISQPDGTGLKVTIAGECGGTWCVVRDGGQWQLTSSVIGRPAAEIAVPQEIAWRIFTKGIAHADAEPRCVITGDRELASHLLTLTAIVG